MTATAVWNSRKSAATLQENEASTSFALEKWETVIQPVFSVLNWKRRIRAQQLAKTLSCSRCAMRGAYFSGCPCPCEPERGWAHVQPVR